MDVMEEKDMEKLLVLKYVLLLRRHNRYESKEKQMEDMYKYLRKGYLTVEELKRHIEYLKHPEIADWDEDYVEDMEEEATPCCTNRDYGPSNPWDAPGMSIHDFI